MGLIKQNFNFEQFVPFRKVYGDGFLRREKIEKKKRNLEMEKMNVKPARYRWATW